MTIGVLFVCTANLCRSPTAEGVFRTMVQQAGLDSAFTIDSAGTIDRQVGNPPTSLAIEVAAARGYEVPMRKARQITSEDIVRFDYVLAMERRHLAELRWMAPRDLSSRPQLLSSFAPPAGIVDIIDPYGRGRADYERALDLIEASCRGLLHRLTPLAKGAISARARQSGS